MKTEYVRTQIQNQNDTREGYHIQVRQTIGGGVPNNISSKLLIGERTNSPTDAEFRLQQTATRLQQSATD